MYVSIFYCFLEPFSTYIKLYILSLNTGDLVHSIESKWSSSPFLFVCFFCLFFFRRGQFLSQGSRAKCPHVTCRQWSNLVPSALSPTHPQGAACKCSLSWVPIPFHTWQDWAINFTKWSKLTKWYVSSFWDHCWSCAHALGSTLHVLRWPNFALLLKAEKFGVCTTFGNVFPLGRISCCPCVTKRRGFSVLGLRTARTAWLWGRCTNLVTLGLSYGAL